MKDEDGNTWIKLPSREAIRDAIGGSLAWFVAIFVIFPIIGSILYLPNVLPVVIIGTLVVVYVKVKIEERKS